MIFVDDCSGDQLINKLWLFCILNRYNDGTVKIEVISLNFCLMGMMLIVFDVIVLEKGNRS